MPRGDTRTQLLDVAQRLVQARSYNAFSFKDLAAEIGIRTASIHYHFRTKGDLGVALMQRYIEMGMRFILCGSDLSLLMGAASARASDVRALHAP